MQCKSTRCFFREEPKIFTQCNDWKHACFLAPHVFVSYLYPVELSNPSLHLKPGFGAAYKVVMKSAAKISNNVLAAMISASKCVI